MLKAWRPCSPGAAGLQAVQQICELQTACMMSDGPLHDRCQA